MKCSDYAIIIINIYMPFLDRSDLQCAITKYDEVIGFVDFIMSENPEAKFVVLGDFNCNFYNPAHPFAASLTNFITSRDLICTFSLMDSFNVDSTYTRYDSRSKSILDFVFISRDLSNCVTKVSIGDFHDNHSDHLPVEVELLLQTPIVHERSSHLSNVTNIMWSKLSPSNLSHYSSTMETALDFLDIPPSILHGQNLCSDDSHKCDLEMYFSQIIDCITLADSVLKRSCFRALKPYWSPELSFLKHQFCIHHKAWLDNGKPTTGYIYNNYLVSRSDYRRKLRQDKRSKLKSANKKMY